MAAAGGSLRWMVISAVMAALALLLPVAFHAAGLGSKFLPMLLPLLVNAFLVPLGWATATAALAPWISALATGMPPLYPPLAAILSAEAAAMAAVAALLYDRGRRSLWVALLPAVLVARAVSFGLTFLLAGLLGLPAALASAARLVESLPGVALQLVVVPLVLRALDARNSVLVSAPER